MDEMILLLGDEVKDIDNEKMAFIGVTVSSVSFPGLPVWE